MPITASQWEGLALAAAGAFKDRVPERAGAAERHASEEALLACGKMRVGRQEAGQELAQNGAEIRPGLAAGGEPRAESLHGRGAT